MTSALRHAGFRRLAAVYATNGILEWFGSVAVMVLVYEVTNSAAVAAAMLLCKQVVPGLVIAPVSAWLDRVDARLALALSFFSHAGALTVLVVAGHGWWLYPAAVVAGSASAIARGLIRADVARVLPGRALRHGNAVLNLVLGLVAPVGPVIAALAIANGGAVQALAVSAGMLALLGLFTLFGRRAAPLPEAHASEAPSELARAVRSHGRGLPVAVLIGLAAVTTCISAIDEPSLLAFARDSLGAGLGGYGAIFAAQAVGVTLGGILFSRLLNWSMVSVYALGTALVGIGYLGMGIAPSIEIACALGVVAGVGAGMDWVALVTAAQEATPAGHEARVTARIEAAGMAGPGVGLLLGGVIAEVASPRLALVVPGLIAFVAVLAIGVLLAQSGRSPRRTALTLPTSIPEGSA